MSTYNVHICVNNCIANTIIVTIININIIIIIIIIIIMIIASRQGAGLCQYRPSHRARARHWKAQACNKRQLAASEMNRSKT